MFGFPDQIGNEIAGGLPAGDQHPQGAADVGPLDPGVVEVVCPEVFDFPIESGSGTFLKLDNIEQKLLIASISAIELRERK